MTEKSFFFDGTAEDPRSYSASDYANYFHQFLSNGVFKKETGSNLGITASGTDMTVSLGTGNAFINGYMYENDSALTLTHDVAEATLDRIDRIVLRLDKTAANRYIRAFVKKGTADSAPVAPTLQQDAFVYEIAIAQVRITAGKSFIEQTQVTDERVYVVILENMYAKKQQENWIKAVMENGFQHFDTVSSIYDGLYYMKDDMGFVHLKGMTRGTSTTNNVIIFTLPTGYRPSKTQVFSCMGADISASQVATRVNIDTSGKVNFGSGACTDYLTLSGLTFKAEQ
jgi:hypothetical protein